MYNTKYECRYYKDTIFFETDEISEDEKYFIRDLLYKEDLLQIFDINEDIDNDTFMSFEFITDIYKNLSKCDEFIECMKLAAAKIMSENEEMGLCILYSYDFMYLTHSCVSFYLENGNIPISLLQPLINKLREW